jgi:hypothetical protein
VHLAVTRADLAIARVGDGNIDGAEEALRPTLLLPPERRLAGAMRRMKTLHRELTGPKYASSAKAAGVAEDIASFIGSAGVA